MGIKVLLEDKGRFGERPALSKGGRPVIYPFATMEKGQTFFVSDTIRGKKVVPANIKAIRSLCSRHNRGAKKFYCHIATKSGITGVRVWRTE